MQLTQDSESFTYLVNKPLISDAKLPSGRGGTAVAFADGKLVVFGGHYFAGDENYVYLDETWLLDVEKFIWNKVNCTGEIPPPRYGHSAHILGSRLFIFGGKGPKDVVYKDVYFLDLVEWVWVPVNTISICPQSRFFHSSEIVGRKIVIHGGWNGSEVFNDLWIFNTDSFVWTQPKTAGFGPTPRYGHTLTLTLDGRLLVIGGCSILEDSGLPKYHDDLRCLDTDTMVWSRPRLTGHTLTGRYGHTTSLLEDGKVVVYGGWGKYGCQSKDLIKDENAYSIQILDTKQMIWHIPKKVGSKSLKHLYNHGASKFNDNSIIVFGGYDGRQALNDFYVINFDLENQTN